MGMLVKNKKLLKITIVSIVGLFFLVLIVSAVIAKQFLNKDYLVDKLEESLNSKVVVGAVDFSVLGGPANLTLQDVSFSPKGGGGEAPIKLKEVSVRVGLMDLLTKHIDVSSIIIHGAEVNVVFRKDGSNSLDELFEKPDAEKAKKRINQVDKNAGSKDLGGDSDGFNAFEQKDFVATLGRFSIKDSQLNIVLEEMGLKLSCSDVNLDLHSIKIDPKKLHETNSADLDIKMFIKADSEKNGSHGEVYLSGSSQTTIFNPETGDLEPNAMGAINISDESWLNTNLPIVEKAWDKLSLLEKIKVNVSPLPEKATFGRSKAIAVHYHHGKMTLLKPISIWVGDWEIAALAESWLQSETDQHMMQVELLASEKSSRRFSELIEKGVQKLPRKVREQAEEHIQKQIIRDKRILLALQSSGDFSNPKVRPTELIKSYEELAKELGKDYLKDKGDKLLKGLFEKF